MSLGDPQYLLFLAFAVVVFHMLRSGRAREIWLLLASYVFYFNLAGLYIGALVFVTGVSYAGALLLDPRRKTRRRNLLLAIVCVALLMPLILLKYVEPARGIGADIASFSPDHSALVALALPVGISFFTFVAVGYLIDVYLEVIEPERSAWKFALFLAFFPLVTAGPIERGAGLLPQFGVDRPFSSERALCSLRLVFVGLFLKVVCADRLLPEASAMFDNPSAFGPLGILSAMLHYVFYIYTDFAGYSLIAIGSAALFGFRVRPNFQQPFLSAGIPEFWRNWHSSLSSWIRDYLFMPVRAAMRRHPKADITAALMLSFLVIGVWHGAASGFAVFGLMHGVMTVTSHFTRKQRDRFWLATGVPASLVHLWRVACAFALVLLTYVAFGAHSLADALTIYRGLLSFDLTSGARHASELSALHAQVRAFPWAWAIIALVVFGDVLVRNGITLERFPRPVQFVAYNAGMLLIIYGGLASGAGQPFFYYQF